MQVRFGRAGDIGELKEWNSWPREKDWHRLVEYEQLVVAEDGAQPVGYAFYTLLWCTVPFLGMIWLREEYQGRGGSRMLLEFLEDHLRRSGYAALLSSSQTDEPGPQRWHVHMGFHTSGVIEHIADADIGEIVYRKELD